MIAFSRHPEDAPSAALQTWSYASVLTLLFLTGTLCVALPFWGDQALFAIYARQLTEGAVLYRDVFDVKQPGIFWFYEVGGLLFGFTEIGIHAFELLYWFFFVLFVPAAFRRYFTAVWAPFCVPVFTVVVYYLYAGVLDLTQVEILVAFPLTVTWWLLATAKPQMRSGLARYAAAGLATALIVLLKHLYVLIVLAFLGYSVRQSYRRGVQHPDILRCVVAFSFGLGVPLTVVIAYFASHGQLGRMWWAYFEMSAAAQLLFPRPLSHIVGGARRFLIGHGAIVSLAVVAALHEFLQGPTRRRDLVAGMLLWVAAGALAFFVLQGWPEYKWPLFTVPIGILGVIGLEIVAGWTRSWGRPRTWAGLSVGLVCGAMTFVVGFEQPPIQTRLLGWIAIAVVAAAGTAVLQARPRIQRALLALLLVALPALVALALIWPVTKARGLATYDFAVTSTSRVAYHRSLSHSYAAADHDLEILRRRSAMPYSLYVFGDPVLLLRANRPQPVPILGWGPEFLDERAWRELERDLRSSPPTHIVVDPYVESFILTRRPAVMHWILSAYEVAFVGASGTWYETRAGRR